MKLQREVLDVEPALSEQSSFENFSFVPMAIQERKERREKKIEDEWCMFIDLNNRLALRTRIENEEY